MRNLVSFNYNTSEQKISNFIFGSVDMSKTSATSEKDIKWFDLGQNT